MQKIVYFAVCVSCLFAGSLCAANDTVAVAISSPDGTIVAEILDHRPIILIRDANTGKLLRTLRGPTIESDGASFYDYRTVVFSPDGKKIIAIAHSSPFGWAISPEMFRALNVRERMEHSRMSLEMSRKTRLAEAEVSAPRIWNLDTGKALSLRGHGGYSESDTTEFSPDGQRIVSTNDNVVRTWDARTGRLLQTSRKTNADTTPPEKK